jgi:3-phenylpropionate/trans-cinnamate dioxygenase ferredoxin reductase component
MAKEQIIIIGGGRAAASLVEAYRDAGGDSPITLISSDDQPPYNRPPLSKGVLRGEMEPHEALVRGADEYEDLLVELRLGVRAEAVDTDRRSVALDDGSEIGYGKLVIATGATPRTLAVPGADLPAVHTFRTLADAMTVREAAADARRAVVVGGSFIGSEVAASLRMLGLEVTIVEAGDRMVPALGSDELSAQVADLYRKEGVELALGEEIEEFRANGLMLVGARLASGAEVEAFLAVVGIGVEPNVAFLSGSGVDVDDGVVVDDRFRTSISNVYAIGDVAFFVDTVAGRRRRVEHWSSANAQGACLGRDLAGGRTAFADVSVFFTKLFDLQLQVIGDPGGGVDEVVIRGSIPERKVLGFQLRDERLVGAIVVGQAQDMVDELARLVREQPILEDRGRLAQDNARPTSLFRSS